HARLRLRKRPGRIGVVRPSSNRPERARDIDEMFVGSFPRMIRPCAGVRERVERRIPILSWPDKVIQKPNPQNSKGSRGTSRKPLSLPRRASRRERQLWAVDFPLPGFYPVGVGVGLKLLLHAIEIGKVGTSNGVSSSPDGVAAVSLDLVHVPGVASAVADAPHLPDVFLLRRILHGSATDEERQDDQKS